MTINKSLLAIAFATALSACSQSNTDTASTEQTAAPNTQNAQDSQHSAHAHHDTTMPMAEHTSEYMQSMNTMHDAMMTAATKANADVAFVEGMIPHHQGAIEMAKIQLKYGQDDQIKNLAQGIIDAQDPEIALMKQWLASRGISQ